MNCVMWDVGCECVCAHVFVRLDTQTFWLERKSRSRMSYVAITSDQDIFLQAWEEEKALPNNKPY